MKHYKIIRIALLIMIILTGCQKEIDVTILPPPEDAFTINSTAAELVKQTSLHDGSFDNILDRTSCASLVLPVTVIVNDIEIIIASTDDLVTVERILDEDPNDEDEVEIIFPVTLLLADYSKISVANEDALEAIREQCNEGGEDDDIECIDFVYPFKITVYDITNQLSKVITIEDDSELHHFIEALEEGELISFAFPVVMLLADGTEITIHNNEEVETSIEAYADDCDEDDDNDFDDDDVDDSTFIAVLIDGSWRVSYFFKENENETSHFTNYTFTFSNDGSVLATNGVTTINGTWTTNGDGGVVVLRLYLGESDPFEEISEDWKVIEFTTTSIKLVDDIEKPTPERELFFEKI